jgi:hypothetical protein
LRELQATPATRPGPPSSLPAPRVRVRQTAAGHAVEPALDGTVDLDEFHSRFLAACGTTEQIVAEALLQDLLGVFHTNPTKPLDTVTANLVLALMHSIGPADTVEAMLGSQMIVAHVASMDAARRAAHIEQTPGGRQTYLSLARKLMTLFTVQIDALNGTEAKERHRRS